MRIIPAIDLRGGKVVRLNQGDFDRQTTFADDPVLVARQFVDAGAKMIHVVDLDGALEGSPQQTEIYGKIADSVPVPIELGGGIRTDEDVTTALNAGAWRVVLGTAAIEDPDVVIHTVLRHGTERIVVGLDANDGKVAVSGWRDTTDVQATALMTRMFGIGVRRFAFTDIARDGTLTEPNFGSIGAMVYHGLELGPAKVIASGGIGQLDHLQRLAGLGVEAAIVGSAIYRGTVDLEQAIREVEED